MCELFAMSGREPATVNISLGVLAEHGGKSAPHADGWGIAFYDENDIRILRDTTCASQSKWVEFVARQKLRSRLVLSHIRKATDGVIALKNTQPFSRELGGRMHVFAHNGHVPKIRGNERFPTKSFHPIGNTDSEIAFCALLERMKPLWNCENATPESETRFDTVTSFANELGELGLANFLYSDGELLFVHGHRRKQPDGEYKAPGLYVLHRQCTVRDPYAETAGVSVTSTDQDVILVASVPLTVEAWQPLKQGEVLMISRGEIINRVAVE